MAALETMDNPEAINGNLDALRGAPEERASS
jgi:hypothetical protein